MSAPTLAALAAAADEIVDLNLANAAFDDAGLAQLGESASLRELYVWQTGASADGVAQLRARRPDLVVDFGAQPAAAAR